MKKILIAIGTLAVSMNTFGEEPLYYCGTYISKQHGIQKALATVYDSHGVIEYKAEGDGWTRSYMSEFDKASIISPNRIRLWNDTDPRTYGQWEFQGDKISTFSQIIRGCI
ncbi:hypothetical protein PMAL9190_03027 [Photobacterium malacitanum]|uniref:Uncharacterized protein n=1 Tax=Photobacterium malacitanum TaxID=2204294 RepID=A0A1Y6MNW9_9GAMM|nr:hypothetical protein [Photobacterium malacitanum]SMY37490.1 hypothetical protein PMAL9190_03027 [Photobacterium malacitanum]